MKKLTKQIGEHEISVVYEPNESGDISFAATCGATVRRHTHTLHPQHDRTQEQFDKDIEAAAQLIAEESAGHEKSRILLANHFSEDHHE